jgi:hypothetical protein
MGRRVRLIVGLPLIVLAGLVCGVVGMLTNGKGRS